MTDRRRVLGALGVGVLASLTPLRLRAATTPRVVVVGGGMAGAAAAKYLRLWSGRTVDVTLVEASSHYVSNIMSNLVVTGQKPASILTFNHNNLVRNYGIRRQSGTVTSIVPGDAGVPWMVSVVQGSSLVQLPADRVVVAPGVQFDPVPLSTDPSQAAPVLHAWQAGPQTTQLRDQLAALPPTGTVVMTIPPVPYRCPPGPYERACLIADYLKRNKPSARLVVLDANSDIVVEKESFSHAFATLYSAHLSYLPGRTLKSVQAVAGQPGGSVVVEFVHPTLGRSTEVHHAQVLNVIPPHRAGAIAHTAGLTDLSGFAPVDGRSFESTMPGKAGLHVIGDASKTTLPKAGHVGNQEGKICADAILRAFAGQQPFPTPTANSACFTPISSTQASWLTAIYQYELDATGAWKFVARDQVSGSLGATEAQAPSSKQFSQMGVWYQELMKETFS